MFILPKVHPFVMSKLSVGHISMVPNDLADMFRGHVLLLGVHKAKLSFFSVALGLQLLPFPCCKIKIHLKCTFTNTCKGKSVRL